MIRENAEALGARGELFGRTRIHRRDATDLGPRPASDGPAFDLAFLDPPYGQGLGERALAQLAYSVASAAVERTLGREDARVSASAGDRGPGRLGDDPGPQLPGLSRLQGGQRSGDEPGRWA